MFRHDPRMRMRRCGSRRSCDAACGCPIGRRRCHGPGLRGGGQDRRGLWAATHGEPLGPRPGVLLADGRASGTGGRHLRHRHRRLRARCGRHVDRAWHRLAHRLGCFLAYNNRLGLALWQRACRNRGLFGRGGRVVHGDLHRRISTTGRRAGRCLHIGRLEAADTLTFARHARHPGHIAVDTGPNKHTAFAVDILLALIRGRREFRRLIAKALRLGNTCPKRRHQCRNCHNTSKFHLRPHTM